MKRSDRGAGSSLAKDAVGGMLLRVATLAATYAATIVLARALGAAEFGSYSFYLTAAILLSFPLHLGLANLLLRETAIASSASDWSRVWGLMIQANRLALFGSIIAGLLIALLFVLAQKNGVFSGLTAALSCLLVPIYALCALRAAVLRANRMPVKGQVPDQLIRPLILVALAILLLVFGAEIDDATAMGLTIIAAAVGLAVGQVLLWKSLPRRPPVIPRTPFKFSTLAAFSFLAGATIINSSIGVVFLGVFSSDAEVGLYKVADQTALLVAFVLGAVNLVIAPKIAKLFAEGRFDVLQRLLVASSQLALAAAVPMFTLFVVFGEDLLSLLFGAGYVKSYAALSILAGGHVMSSLAGSVALVMNMSGNERLTLRISIVGACINFALCVLLFPLYGIVGVALASAASTVFWNIGLAIFVLKRLGINCTALGPVRLGSFMEKH